MPRRAPVSFVLAMVIAVGGLPAAYGADPVPEAVAPGRLEKRFERPPEPKAVPQVVVPRTAAPLPPEQAAQIRFVLQRVEVTNVTVLPPEEVAALYGDLVGREISLADLYRLGERITALYGSKGYLLSRAFIPPQTITDGVVRIAAVEGYVDKVVFEGHGIDRPALFDYLAERIRGSRPLNAADLERYVLLANDLPGMKAQAVLKPSTDNSGAATLVVDLQQRGFDGMASLDNYGTDAVGSDQLFVEGSANSLFGLQERTTVRAATVPSETDELAYYFLGHAQVLNGEGLVLGFEVTQSRSEPGERMLQLLRTETRSDTAGVSLSYPWRRSRSSNLTVKAALDYRDSESRLLDFTQGHDQQYVVRASLAWDRADTGGVSLVAATLNRGLADFDAQVESRIGAPVDFTSLHLQASRRQTLAERWSLLVRLGAQAAGDPLPSSELFGVGGESFGRGYDPSEFTGDQGVGGSIDLQFRPAVEFVSALQGYLFADAASVQQRLSDAGPKSREIASAGLGLQMATAADVTLSLEAAKPLRERASEADNNDWRLFGRLVARF